MDPISFWRRRYKSSTVELLEGTSISYCPYDGFGIINTTADGVKKYVKTENFDDGAYTPFVPSVEPNPTGNIKLASLNTATRDVFYRAKTADTLIKDDMPDEGSWDVKDDGTIIGINFAGRLPDYRGADKLRIIKSVNGGASFSESIVTLPTKLGVANPSFSIKQLKYCSGGDFWLAAIYGHGIIFSNDDCATWSDITLSYDISHLAFIQVKDRLIWLFQEDSGLTGFSIVRGWLIDSSGNIDVLGMSHLADTSATSKYFGTGFNKTFYDVNLFSTTARLFKIDQTDPANAVVTAIAETDIDPTWTTDAEFAVWTDTDTWDVYVAMGSGGSFNVYKSAGNDLVNWTKLTLTLPQAATFLTYNSFDKTLIFGTTITDYYNNRLVAAIDFSDPDNAQNSDYIYMTERQERMEYTDTGDVYYSIGYYYKFESSIHKATTTATGAIDLINYRKSLWYYTRPGTSPVIDSVFVTTDPFSTDPNAWTDITSQIGSGIASAGVPSSTNKDIILAEKNGVISAAVSIDGKAMVVVKSGVDDYNFTVQYSGFKNLKYVFDKTANPDDRIYDTTNVTFVTSAQSANAPVFTPVWGRTVKTLTSTNIINAATGFDPNMGGWIPFVFANGSTATVQETVRATLDSYTLDSNNNITSVTITKPVLINVEPGDEIKYRIGIYNASGSGHKSLEAIFELDPDEAYLEHLHVDYGGYLFNAEDVEINVVRQSGTSRGAAVWKGKTYDYKIPTDIVGNGEYGAAIATKNAFPYTEDDYLLYSSLPPDIYFAALDSREMDFQPYQLNFNYYGLFWGRWGNRRSLTSGVTEDTTGYSEATSYGWSRRTVETISGHLHQQAYISYGNWSGYPIDHYALVRYEYSNPDGTTKTVRNYLGSLRLDRSDRKIYLYAEESGIYPSGTAMPVSGEIGFHTTGLPKTKAAIGAFYNIAPDWMDTVGTTNMNYSTYYDVSTDIVFDGEVIPPTEFKGSLRTEDKSVIFGENFLAYTKDGTTATVLSLIQELNL